MKERGKEEFVNRKLDGTKDIARGNMWEIVFNVLNCCIMKISQSFKLWK